MRLPTLRRRCALFATLAAAAAAATVLAAQTSPPAIASGLAVKHVVVIFQENHSFDDVLGRLCVDDARCDGATTGLTSSGTVVPLQPEPDIVPFAVHEQYAQVKAIDGGKMDRFDKNPGCHEADGYLCYTQFSPDQIPNLAALARAFVVSDRTFEDGTNPSWGSHLDLVATQLDGFLPGGPPGTAPGTGLGLGCDSGLDAPWRPTPDATAIQVPACVPKPDGSGPYRPSPVTWVPTIMDRLQQMNRSWRIYAALDEGIGYGWAICPTFADCIYSRQARHLVSKDQVLTDAQAGTLPNFSIVVPKANDSQHNNQSMLRGDNWIGSVVSAIMNGPDWRSTAIFITYDDCGCFYDHVPPPPNLGIRVPMVIVSPYARSGYTDSNNASYASMLAFVEHNFGIPPLSNVDGNAYDYANSFDYGQKPLAPIPLHQRELPTAEQQWLAEHPAPPDDT